MNQEMLHRYLLRSRHGRPAAPFLEATTEEFDRFVGSCAAAEAGKAAGSTVSLPCVRASEHCSWHRTERRVGRWSGPLSWTPSHELLTSSASFFSNFPRLHSGTVGYQQVGCYWVAAFLDQAWRCAVPGMTDRLRSTWLTRQAGGEIFPFWQADSCSRLPWPICRDWIAFAT